MDEIDDIDSVTAEALVSCVGTGDGCQAASIPQRARQQPGDTRDGMTLNRQGARKNPLAGLVRSLPSLVRLVAAAVGQHLAPMLRSTGHALMTNRVQVSMAIINVLLIKVAVNALRKARFAAQVRVVKDLKPDDLKYLLGKLPPWISSPEWEAGKPAQELLGLLWPALNSTICLALKNVIEDRMQGSAEYGHIKFSRFSLGRSPPQICGIKAVPLHEEDVLAMVVDLDVRWAGEPDVVLHLSRLKRVNLGLKNLQVSTMVRLVFTPIIEDPPFFQRMTVTLLNRPLIDFTIKVLGGPDIMSLPAVSSWLHAAILGLTDRFIVWPKEVNVALIPNLRSKNNLPMLSPLASSPPMGVLIVTIEGAKLQKRRSTFLGRFKLPNPRIAMITPKGETDGVAQMTLTDVNEKTLDPSWKHSSVFVIGSMEQPLRFLLSHRRVESYFGADMPLGSAEVDVMELLRSFHVGSEDMEDIEGDQEDKLVLRLARTPSTMSIRSFKSCLSRSSAKSRDLSGFDDSLYGDEDDGYASACSEESTGSSPSLARGGSTNRLVFSSRARSPAVSGKRSSPWGSPKSPISPPSPSSSISFSPFSKLAAPNLHPSGTNGTSSHSTTPAEELTQWNAAKTPPSKIAVPWQTNDGSRINRDHVDPLDLLEHETTHSLSLSGRNWETDREGSTWIDVKSSPAMTMSGLVHNALQPLKGLPSTPYENSFADLGSESNLAKAFLRSLRSFMMRSAFPGDNEDSDGESVEGDAGGGGDVGNAGGNNGNETSRPGPRRPINLENVFLDETRQTAKVKISYRWIPVSSDRPALGEKPSARGNHPGHAHRQRPTRPLSAALTNASGVVGIRVAFTKIDYGDNPLHPILSLSVLPTMTNLTSAPLEHLKMYPDAEVDGSDSLKSQDTLARNQRTCVNLSRLQKSHRVFSTECQAGHRPGVLHWGQVFHLPVWKADTSKVRIELGNISSALKLSSYGTDLFLLEASSGLYDADVEIEASTNIPLKDVVKKGFVDQNYRLREAKTEKIPGVLDDQRLDIGRVAISMSWHPMVVRETDDGED